MKRLFLPLILMCLLIGVIPIAAQTQPPTVIATTSILADIAQQVSGGLINVETLLPPGTDPHGYQPTVDDAAHITDAQLIIASGAGYEHFLNDLLQSAGTNIPVVLASSSVEVLAVGDHNPSGSAWMPETLGLLGEGLVCAGDPAVDVTTAALDPAATPDGQPSPDCDPHVWMNPWNVVTWANNIADAFSRLDPANEAAYYANADAYATDLEALDLELQNQIADIPEDRRVLVTDHEYMGYFAAQYGFRIAATVLPGASGEEEADPQRVAALITLMQTQQIPVIFVGMGENPQMAQTIVSDAGGAAVVPLYVETLSTPEGDAPTYIDMMRYDAQVIADALR